MVFAIQDNGTTQVLNPQLSGTELSIPTSINFQGYLYRDGIPMDTTMDIWFGIYTALVGGSLMYQITRTDVTITDGWFTVILTSIPSSIFPVGGPTRYLEVKAPSTGPALEPRLSLVSVGYSYHSITADSAETANNIKDGAVTMAKINPSGATAGQVIKWTGTAWAPRNDSVLSGGIPDSIPGNLAVGGELRVHSKARLGYSCYNNGFAAFCAGYGNSAGGDRASIAGGEDNSASGQFSHIGGGSENLASGRWTMVGGGNLNVATDTATTIAGGSENYATARYAVVGGGANNNASAAYTTIGGGTCNDVASTYATVAGGITNRALGDFATVCGGYGNIASYEGATVSGGCYNSAANCHATVSGGYVNEASGYCATVSGGASNKATDYGAAVSGGYDNSAIGCYAFVGGGRADTATAAYCAVLSGYGNKAGNDVMDTAALVVGGRGNSVTWKYSSVLGGENNKVDGCRHSVICGGQSNRVAHNFTTASGYANLVSGLSSVAFGQGDTVNGSYGFATNAHSYVPVGSNSSAAFNGQTSTGYSQLRCDDLYANSMIFGMDHPLDLDNKILNQFAVASPEILVTFRGACVIGTDGKVQVNLPDYFDALCRNPMVQLTGVGTPEVIFVAKDVLDNRFTIGGPVGTKVYWVVTGERKDQLAEVTRTLTPVEQTRTDELIGRSINEASLANKMPALEQKGFGSKFNFRTAAGKSRYENSRKLMEAKP
jgi:hypothetical protein